MMSDFTCALRQLAEWYEMHPTLPEPVLPVLNVFADNKEHFMEIARQIGKAKKDAYGHWFALVIPFGAFTLEFNIPRDKVCTARRVGTRIVKARPAEPEHEEPVYEWDCSSILEG